MAIRNSAKTSADIKNSLDGAIKTYFEEEILILWRVFWKEEQLNKRSSFKNKKKTWNERLSASQTFIHKANNGIKNLERKLAYLESQNK